MRPRALLFVLLALFALPAGAQEGEKKVTPETFIRAETDREFHQFVKNAGGKVNTFFYIRKPAPLDQQSVIRMNRDTLYMGAVVDTKDGATVTMPKIPDGRYASILVLDNDHYAPQVIYEPGTHKIESATRYVTLAVRIQVKNPNDPAEIALVNKLQDEFKIDAKSADPLPPYRWEKASLDELRANYEKEFQKYAQYEADWQGKPGEVNEKTRHLAAAGAWGLFPERDAVYINYSGGHDHTKCYCATFKAPENKAFWSITVYGKDGYMKSDTNTVNSSNVKLNPDGTFTVHFGSKEACGDVPNRVDITEGWNYLMRVYRPGKTVLERTYKLPAAKACEKPARPAARNTTPADFGVWDVAYKVSETDFNIKRSLAKAPLNAWAHQTDVSTVKTQQVIRENQDVIYSSAVVDIRKGATITVPKGETYHIIEIIDMQNYVVDVLYPGRA